MGNMHTTKTINYKDEQHAHHQKQLTTKMGKMYITKTIKYKDGQHVHHKNN